MSAASPATSQVRRTAAAAPSRPVSQPARPAMHAAPALAFVESNEDEFKLNLGDIPRQQENMDIEGFKPTLLSRLFDLVAPLK